MHIKLLKSLCIVPSVQNILKSINKLQYIRTI